MLARAGDRRTAAVVRPLALLAGLGVFAWYGCGSSAPPPRDPELVRASQVVPLAEEFDPQSLREDLLLIQPQRPLPAAGQPQVTVPEHSLPAVEQEPADSGQVQRTAVYRVQLIALSRSDVAQQRRAMLEQQLGVPVRIVSERNLHLLRAGECASEEEAEVIRARAAALSPEYADAYIVAADELVETSAALSDTVSPPTTETAEAVDATVPVGQAEPPAAVSAPPAALVPAFGWRVLLDKVDNYAAAQRLKQDASRQLRRSDIDVTFKAPWYNVEVGYYRTEAEAQEALERLERRFPNALKVRGQILVPAEE